MKRLKKHKSIALVGAIIGFTLPLLSAQAGINPVGFPNLLQEETVEKRGEAPPPLTLRDVERIKRQGPVVDEGTGLAFDIRAEAIREAAISYGARAGLAFRTYAITTELEDRARHMDKVFDFTQLLVPAPSGLLIEPPIINESINALLIEGNGQEAAVSDRVYNIVNNARIVSTSRNWRDYLRRSWDVVDPPPDLLLPENDEERELWIELVNKGWVEGVKQANEIFEADLAKLKTDFNGMIRYRILLAQGMISPPYALQVDRGITGGGEILRVGDRAVQITGVPALITGANTWQPASR